MYHHRNIVNQYNNISLNTSYILPMDSFGMSSSKQGLSIQQKILNKFQQFEMKSLSIYNLITTLFLATNALVQNYIA